MKTNVITLEEYDNLASALEKMSWASPGRILLVFPERGQVLRNEIEFLQIIRKAQDKGANLALVTRDLDLLRICDQRNISTFSNLRRAQRSRWKKRLAISSGRPEIDQNREVFETEKLEAPAAKKIPQWGRIALLAAGILAALLVIATFLPGATLYIQPLQQTQEILIQVEASEDVESIGLTGSIPIHKFSVIVEGSLTSPTSGSAVVPDGIAGGTVSLQSTTSEDIFIPAGSMVQALEDEDILFHTLEDVLLSVENGTEQSVEIIAENPGSEANLPASSQLKLQGIYREFVLISNPLALSGGSEKSTKAATAEDINTLREDLITDLQAQGFEQIRAQIEAEDLLLNDDVTLQRILSEEYFPEQPTPSSELTLTMEVEFVALVVQHSDLRSLSDMVLNANLPEGYTMVQNSLIILPVGEPQQNEKGHYNWEILAKRTIEGILSPEDMKWGLLNQPLEEVESILAEKYIAGISSAFEVSPGFWPRLPLYPFRLEVIVE